jgi:hypothetical protein
VYKVRYYRNKVAYVQIFDTLMEAAEFANSKVEINDVVSIDKVIGNKVVGNYETKT